MSSYRLNQRDNVRRNDRHLTLDLIWSIGTKYIKRNLQIPLEIFGPAVAHLKKLQIGHFLQSRKKRTDPVTDSPVQCHACFLFCTLCLPLSKVCVCLHSEGAKFQSQHESALVGFSFFTLFGKRRLGGQLSNEKNNSKNSSSQRTSKFRFKLSAVGETMLSSPIGVFLLHVQVCLILSQKAGLQRKLHVTVSRTTVNDAAILDAANRPERTESRAESILTLLGIVGTVLNLLLMIFVYIYTSLWTWSQQAGVTLRSCFLNKIVNVPAFFV